jgi:hypothetical protein
LEIRKRNVKTDVITGTDIKIQDAQGKETT